MVTHVLDDLSLDGDGHKAYPAGACSPVHFSGCLRCLEAENVTLSEQLGEAQSEAIKLSVLGHKQRQEIDELKEQLKNADTQIATLKAHAGHIADEARDYRAQLERCKTRLTHAEANYGEELKRARAFEAQAQELAALLAKK